MKTGIFLLCILSGFCFGRQQILDAVEYVNDENFEEATTILTGYLNEHPSDGPANYVLAVVLSRQRKYDRALAYIGNAIRVQPDKGEYYQLQAQLYEEAGNIKKAVQSWEMCQKNSRDPKLFMEAKNHIDFLKEK